MNKEKEVLVKVEGLGKKFCKDFKRSLRYGALDMLHNTLNIERKQELRSDEFWAVNDVNFELRRGDSIGVIGHNGAGKSTLLKMLNGIIKPDKGRVEMRGRVGALIELGAGFNPILTGRENIYNNGAVLGFSKAAMDSKLEEIIEFSELKDFIDSPVRNYSSGMKVRLGFAVAANLEPDILIIDEVLAVGDVAFRLKCFKKLDSLRQRASVIFVSHSMPQVLRQSSHVILMERGQIEYSGVDVSLGVEKYYGMSTFSEMRVVFDDKTAQLKHFKLNGQEGNEVQDIKYLETLDLDIELKIDGRYKEPLMSVVFFDKEMKPVATIAEEIFENTGEMRRFKVSVPKLCLSNGFYKLTFAVNPSRAHAECLRIEGVKQINVSGGRLRPSPVTFESFLTTMD